MRNEGAAECLKLVCISCTSVVQCERTVVLLSVEMWNFSAAECGKCTSANVYVYVGPAWEAYTRIVPGKAIRSNLRNVPHMIFRKLPPDNFPHSAIRMNSAKYKRQGRV